MLDHHTLTVIYRLAHMAGMAILVGGAVSVVVSGMRPAPVPPDTSTSVLLTSAFRYESVFWPVIAIQVLIGVGMVGLRGGGLPPPDGSWGYFFNLKLMILFGALVLSLIRSAVIAGLLDEAPIDLPRRAAQLVLGAYSITAVTLFSIVFAAVRMSHG